MVNFSVAYDKGVLGKFAIAITNAPREIVEYVKTEIPAFFRKGIVPLTTEPRLPTLPFVWDYDPYINARKRAAYFKTLPRGSRGGRYVRSHKLVNAWIVGSRTLRNGAEASISNDTPYLDTVQGPSNLQYPSHKDSGWVQYDGVLDRTSVQAVDMITNRWLDGLD